jgi:2-C-methyl-D-erythritol 4-phosphate cytidylyltransferase
MKNPVAKQFLPLGGKPILIRTFEAFYRFDSKMQFVLVLFEGLRSQWKELIDEYNFSIPHQIVSGGAERFHSVRNGLDALNDDIALVAIHDAVRPLVSQNTISSCFEAAQKSGAAIPTIPVTDTIRQTGKGTLPRKDLQAVQTPQCFQKKVITQAYQTDFRDSFTDDASVAEFSGCKIKLVSGNRLNIKVTTAEDMEIANALLSLK